MDCDQYTRQFFADKGQPQPEGNLLHMIPKDPYFQRRKAAEEKISLKVPDDRRERFINSSDKCAIIGDDFESTCSHNLFW